VSGASESKRKWRQRQIAIGNCGLCGQPRGNDGTKYLCRIHADRQAKYLRDLRQRRRKSQVFNDGKWEVFNRTVRTSAK
jgi:hypothetical protein